MNSTRLAFRLIANQERRKENGLLNISKLNTDMKALIIPDACSEIREPIKNYYLAMDDYIPVLQEYAELLSEGKEVSEDFYDNELLKRYKAVKETDAVLAAFISKYHAAYSDKDNSH